MKDYKEYYEFPLELDEYIGWVWDSKRNFVFQFEFDDIDRQKILLDVIEGNKKLDVEFGFTHKDGLISYSDGSPVILIRGWGGLTGVGGYNLPPEEAAHVQDTFAGFIVKQLNKR